MAMVLAIAACGGSEDAGDTSTSAPPATTTTAPTTTSTTEATTAPPTTETSSTSQVDGATVMVFFGTGDGSDCGATAPVERALPAGTEIIASALEALVAGPTAEETADGASSFFSAATAGSLRSATLDEGLLLVDFVGLDTLIPNASTSCGSELLLAELTRTTLQFAEVERVRFQLDGSCDRFYEWLQRECTDYTATGSLVVSATLERATGSGCSPGATGQLPDGRWFGYRTSSDGESLSFDLACWFSGRAAEAAAAEDGEESPPPNDYYIRNLDDRERLVPVDPSAVATWLPSPGDPSSATTISYSEWNAAQLDRPLRPGIWLTVRAGMIVAIEEQFQP